MSRYDKIDTLTNPATSANIKGFIDPDFVNSLLDGNEAIINIPDGYQYRPDKLAAYYYNNSTYYWIFYYVNALEKGIEDFYVGRKLIVPSANTVKNIMGE